MNRDAKQRLAESVFRRLGEDALLRDEPTSAVIHHNAEVVDGDYVVLRTVATLRLADEPKRGDVLVMDPGGEYETTYTIDGKPFQSNGTTAKWVLLESTA